MKDKKEEVKKTKSMSDEKLIKEGYITVIAGPCAIESWKQLDAVAKIVKDLGLSYIRGGAYKPRTSPYSFQGLKEEGLKYLREINAKYGPVSYTHLTLPTN